MLMANNRMYLVCKKCEKKKEGTFCFAKFYPQDGFIAGDSSGWFTYESGKMEERLNDFFEKHKHKYDKSMFGGFQYELRYEIIGDYTNEKEQVLNIISKAIKR
jgi:hypothetical protein